MIFFNSILICGIDANLEADADALTFLSVIGVHDANKNLKR